MTTVFLNGCFDLLHVGHLRLIRFAQQQGDRLVVGLNSDKSVLRAKGNGRPVIPQEQRREMLLGLGADVVMIFSDPTPLATVMAVRPDVLVVGHCYSTECESSRQVVASGGIVIQAPEFDPEISTTKIIERIRRTHDTRDR